MRMKMQGTRSEKICEFDYQEKGLGRIALSMLIEELFILRYVGSNSYCQMI